VHRVWPISSQTTRAGVHAAAYPQRGHDVGLLTARFYAFVLGMLATRDRCCIIHVDLSTVGCVAGGAAAGVWLRARSAEGGAGGWDGG
jgi:hypothetical protein